MSERKSKEYDSVDLTEDEDSSCGNSGNDSPFQFVNCSTIITESTSTMPGSKPAMGVSGIAAATLPTKNSKTTASTVAAPKMLIKASARMLCSTLNKKVKQISSIQLKPPTTPFLQNISKDETRQSLETVCLDSDTDSCSSVLLPNPPPLLDKTTEITLPEKDTLYSPKQPPGKVVIIKKNNRYYKIIIPHNVMPNISKSMGPVLINIPEVGPLVISNDPQSTKLQTNQFKMQQQLSLNLDAVEQNAESEALTARRLKENVLRDKKFCWTFAANKKRDLQGFCYADRLGFNKSEAKRAKLCERTMSGLVAKYQSRLTKTVVEYRRFSSFMKKKDKIKLVKINSIIKGTSNTVQSDFDASLESRDEEISSRLEDDSDRMDYDSDLLVTKKVVILGRYNDVEVPPKKPARNKGRPSKVVKNSKQTKANFKALPCVVQIYKNRQVEEASAKYCKDKGVNANVNVKRRISVLSPSEVNASKPFTPANATSPALKNRATEKKELLLGKIIFSEERLQEELNPLKPVLIVTEQTVVAERALEYYCREFDRNNIIFIINCKGNFPLRVLKSQGFVAAAEIGYVKLVESKLFSKFAMNGMAFNKIESLTRAEHNYSFVRK